MIRKPNVIGTCVALVCLMILAGCGGGGSEGSSEPAGTPASDAGSSAATAPTGSGAISGTIKYEGRVPSFPPLDMNADKDCAAKHSGTVPNDAFVVGEGNGLANVYVRVTKGLPEGTHAVPSVAKVLDQRGCQYRPHVMGIMKGQILKILNSDGVLHNVHSLPDKNQVFNRAMPAAVTEIETTFDKVEDPFRVKCDVHPWMGAYIVVTDHPYFAVTGDDGSYSITGLPAGTYEIEAWHEQQRLATQTASVTVADGQAATQDFVFKVQ